MLTGTNLTYTKYYNFRIVFEIIRLHGPISRAEIARNSSLTAQTVSNIVKRMLDDDLVKEGKTVKSKGRGAPSVVLEINPEGSYSIGLDFNRDHLTALLVDLTGRVIDRTFIELDQPAPDEAISLMSDAVIGLIKKKRIPNYKISGIGIGFPGPITINHGNSVTNIVNPKAFPKWKDVPVVELLSKKINVPIFLENNASAAALGERWYGAGRQISTFLYLLFDAGLGGGLLINGQLHDGAHSNAGEVGYLPIPNHLKTPLTDEGLPHIGQHFNLNKLYELLQKNGLTASRPDDLVTLLNEKNEILIDWLELGIKMLIPAIVTIEYLMDPPVTIMGGRLPTPLIQYLKDGIIDQIADYRVVENHIGSDLEIGTAGEDAAALGAATLPMFELFAPQTKVLNKKNGKG